MKVQTCLLAFALVTLAIFWTPAATAATADAQVPVAEALEAAPAPACDTALTFGESPIFTPTVQSASGCGKSSCDLSCRNQGYDYGVCFGSKCICRFWHP